MDEIIITPLGTVSPYCKDNMNCPGFLVEYNNYKFLLDCGNGISRLLKFPDDLNNLKVFITHFHNDHYGDIGTIQYASYVYHNLGLLDKKIEIYLPAYDYNYANKSIIFCDESYAIYKSIDDGVEYKFDDLNISFYNNNSHSIDSYVIKLENNSFKVIYTSDIGNTNLDELIRYCNNSDLIICESSLLNSHKNIGSHLTARDAAVIAKISNSKRLLLTHFWPEIDKNIYLKEAREVFDNSMVSKEGKKLTLRKEK